MQITHYGVTTDQVRVDGEAVETSIDVEAAHHGAHRRKVFLILRRRAGHFDRAAAVRTARRRRRRQGLVDVRRARPASLPAITRTGVVSRERHRRFDADAAVSLQTQSDQTVHMHKVVSTDPDEVRLYCYSEERANKERGIVERFASPALSRC